MLYLCYLHLKWLHVLALVLSYNPRQKSWQACPLLQHLSGKYISSSPTPIQCCLSWWIRHCSFPTLSGGEGGFLFQWCHNWLFAKYLVNAFSCYLILLTFIGDCSSSPIPRICSFQYRLPHPQWLKWPVIVSFSNSYGVPWTENICCIFRMKPSFSYSNEVVWTGLQAVGQSNVCSVNCDRQIQHFHVHTHCG